MATDRKAVFAIPASACLLLWPAVWNGYPIVFADTGTYLSQAINHYAGWDRPVFYSLFMLPLHATLTVWPVIVVQALLAAWILWLVCRTLLPRVSPAMFVAGTAMLSVCTWLPWIVSELMPDLFTPLLVLVIVLLAWMPAYLAHWEQLALAAAAAFMIATQQSSLPLACILFPIMGLLAPLCHRPPSLGHTHRWLLLSLPPALAISALCTVNLLAHDRFAISPFGNVFLLARVIYDGPGLTVLRRDCPEAHWRLCPFLDSLPATSDDFLWSADSPLYRAGGPKAVSLDASAIISAALHADPATEARAAFANTIEQLTRFDSGDGLNPWPAQVSPWIEQDFPAREAAAYAAARQQTNQLFVPAPLPMIHRLVALTGLLACLTLLPIAMIRRAPSTGLLLATIIILPFSAAITGTLSAPHDRYQSRIMWLPPVAATISAMSLRRKK